MLLFKEIFSHFLLPEFHFHLLDFFTQTKLHILILLETREKLLFLSVLFGEHLLCTLCLSQCLLELPLESLFLFLLFRELIQNLLLLFLEFAKVSLVFLVLLLNHFIKLHLLVFEQLLETLFLSRLLSEQVACLLRPLLQVLVLLLQLLFLVLPKSKSLSIFLSFSFLLLETLLLFKQLLLNHITALDLFLQQFFMMLFEKILALLSLFFELLLELFRALFLLFDKHLGVA
mmetsp:Transcript_10208/g.37933  ORF Transcript_10208/g.37933 Transcript_10208/m.37933 type:complete len:231 (-) Transcript_10208:3185-3877(-)